MEEIAETTEQSQKPSFWSSFWFPAVFGFISATFLDFFSFTVAWFSAGIIASCISYFALPKPRIGIVKYFVFIQVCLIVTLFAIRVVPHELREVMPKFWAYALPALLLANAIYFVPPLDGSKRGAWWKWFLGSFVFAGLFGWLMSYVAT